ncbi:hypothetical protein, partial [Propionibacterium freudenreichii]
DPRYTLVREEPFIHTYPLVPHLEALPRRLVEVDTDPETVSASCHDGPMDDDFLKSMGFPASWEETYDLLDDDKLKSLARNERFDHLLVYADPSGASVCMFETSEGFSTETFTVSGHERVPAEVWQVWPGTAEVNVLDEQGELITRVLAFVDDPHMYPWYPLKDVGEPARFDGYRMGAIAVDVAVFDTVDAWRESQTPIITAGAPVHDPVAGLPDEMFLGPTFVTSPWLFALYSGDETADNASPISIFKAVCERVETVTNALTGQQWYRIDADCGFPVTVALPLGITPTPREGSVIDGKAFLTGTTGFWTDLA